MVALNIREVRETRTVIVEIAEADPTPYRTFARKAPLLFTPTRMTLELSRASRPTWTPVSALLEGVDDLGRAQSVEVQADSLGDFPVIGVPSWLGFYVYNLMKFPEQVRPAEDAHDRQPA